MGDCAHGHSYVQLPLTGDLTIYLPPWALNCIPAPLGTQLYTCPLGPQLYTCPLEHSHVQLPPWALLCTTAPMGALVYNCPHGLSHAQLHTYQVSRLRRECHASACGLKLSRLTVSISRLSSHIQITMNYNDYDINSLEEIEEVDCISHAER